MGKNSERQLALEDFIATHSSVLLTALEVYAGNMRDVSAEILGAYNLIKDDPVRSAAQDKTIMTTRGLRSTSQILADSARRAAEAHNALQEIREWSEDDDA
jgi:hypothetical protein